MEDRLTKKLEKGRQEETRRDSNPQKWQGGRVEGPKAAGRPKRERELGTFRDLMSSLARDVCRVGGRSQFLQDLQLGKGGGGVQYHRGVTWLQKIFLLVCFEIGSHNIGLAVLELIETCLPLPSE